MPAERDNAAQVAGNLDPATPPSSNVESHTTKTVPAPKDALARIVLLEAENSALRARLAGQGEDADELTSTA